MYRVSEFRSFQTTSRGKWDPRSQEVRLGRGYTRIMDLIEQGPTRNVQSRSLGEAPDGWVILNNCDLEIAGG